MICQIETLYIVMATKCFRYRLSPWDWSNLFFKRSKLQNEYIFRIETLYMVMVIESFRYKPSPRDWSNLFFKKSKYKKNMVFQIGILYMVMVVESFRYRPSPRDWSIFFHKVKNVMSNWNHLLGNGHPVLFFKIHTIFSRMTKSVFKFVFFWNPNEINGFIFTYLL